MTEANGTERVPTTNQGKVTAADSYHQIVQESKGPIALFKGAGLIIEEANTAALDLMQAGPDVIGRPLLDAIPEMADREFTVRLRQVIETGKPHSGYEVPLTSDRIAGLQDIRYFNYEFYAYRDADGKPAGVMVIASEVTEHVRAKKALTEREEQLHLLSDFMPQIVWATDAAGFHDFYNKRWFEFTGLTFEQTKGEGWAHLLHPDDLERTRQAWAHSLNTGEPYQIEYRMRRADGVYRWLLARAIAFRNEAGAIVRWFGTCTDVHDQRSFAQQLESQVAERTRELLQSNDDLQQFAHVISHDLKEPVRKMRVFAKMLEKEFGPVLPQRGQYYLDKISKGTERLTVMIEGVLHYSSLNEASEQSRMVDLNTVLDHVLSDLELTISQQEAQIEHGQLPAIEAVPILMQQLFYNLLNNALKFSRRGVKPVITISAACRQIDGREFTSIRVSDNGIGFEPEYADRIFGTFTRLHPKDVYEGTGLGLALCKKIVERHKGTIRAEAGKDAGATFILELPLRQ